MELIKEREKVAGFMRRLYERNLTTALGGNVSLKVGERIIITPSQFDKARMQGEQIAMINLEGSNLTPRHKVSMESGMHVAIYKKREDVKAIVHAHPVFATGFAIAAKKIKTNLAGEARAQLGEPVITKYALMGTPELAEIIAAASIESNVIIMQNHGIITLGENLFQAFDRMEVLEASAKMTLITDLLGSRKELTDTELKQIDNLFS